ncbi:MAG: ATP-binding cassette domain-containing protein [Coriobacteriales bacterium]|jgi:putative ABC transport system ATP-binding protein|nr:ATP-binding cassette domain-containing protein [Coriobacteriales bacterium]
MLSIQHISKTFNAGTVNEKLALNDVSLELASGEFLTIIGGNGAGKSVLMSAIAGVYPVDSGSIWIDGVDVTRQPEYRRAAYIGRVFQDPMMGTAANMGIDENLALAYRRGQHRGLRWGISHKEQARYRELLATLELGLEDRLTTKVGLLSGGQRQALTLLMATLQHPRLLILDEHTAALDPRTAKRVLQLSRELIEANNLTAIMITHNMRDAIAFGSRLVMMYDGRMIIDISGEEKRALTVASLLARFEQSSGSDEADDTLLLA